MRWSRLQCLDGEIGMAIESNRDLMDRIRELPLSEQREILGKVQQLIDGSGGTVRSAPGILDLRGVGKELWSTVGVDEYLQAERTEWDG